LGGTDIRPQDSFSYRSNFRFRSSFRSSFRFRSRFRSGSNFRSHFSFSFSFRFSYRSSSSYTTSGDIFYCSGSRQLNHSSCYCCEPERRSYPTWKRAFHFCSPGVVRLSHASVLHMLPAAVYSQFAD